MDTRLLVEQCLDSSKEFTLLAPDGSGRKSTVLLSARLVPVDIVISPRESANNMGILQIEIVDGGDLRAADRSGKSDPYAVLTLNGEKVFKTKEIRKYVAPLRLASRIALTTSIHPDALQDARTDVERIVRGQHLVASRR
jgi:Ca2+-dependent lipid-binding protein